MICSLLVELFGDMKQYYITAIGTAVKVPHSTLCFAQLALEMLLRDYKLCKKVFGVQPSKLYIIHV